MCPAVFVESKGMLRELWKARSTVLIMVDLDLNSGLFDLAELVNNWYEMRNPH